MAENPRIHTDRGEIELTPDNTTIFEHTEEADKQYDHIFRQTEERAAQTMGLFVYRYSGVVEDEIYSGVLEALRENNAPTCSKRFASEQDKEMFIKQVMALAGDFDGIPETWGE